MKPAPVVVEVEVANNRDLVEAKLGYLASTQIRKMTIVGAVDRNEPRLVLPRQVAKELGLIPIGRAKIRYADGRVAKRQLVEGVYLQILGRHGVLRATLERNCETPVIGRLVLADLDFEIDCRTGHLYPRDPRFVVCDI